MVIAGKNSTVVGNKDAPLVLRGQGIKVQWGNRFIDLIKDGKIATEKIENIEILKTIDSVDLITEDGVYLVNNEDIWFCIKGTKLGISEGSDISYLKTQNLSKEQKLKALFNIGFIYNTLDEAKKAELQEGIIYILDKNQLYIVKEGKYTPYINNNQSNSNIQEYAIPSIINNGKIESDTDLKILINNDEYITIGGKSVRLNYDLVISQIFSSDFNFKLLNNKGVYTLVVDNIDWKNYPIPVTYNEFLQKIETEELNPMMYYLITDFQNPWEVSWEDEPLYTENQYLEIKDENGNVTNTLLKGLKNVTQLVVKASNKNTIEEKVYCLEQPDWEIKYDWQYKGDKHITKEATEDSEAVIQYGFRKKEITTVDEFGQTVSTGEYQYLPCKGRITYLKDEYGNEGNFNFREFRFKQEDANRNEIWRYIMDTSDEGFLGNFFPGQNNQFYFEPVTYIQVFGFEPEYEDVEKTIISNYKPYSIDSDVLINGTGHNLHIKAKVDEDVVQGNVFKWEEPTDREIKHYLRAGQLTENQFINIYGPIMMFNTGLEVIKNIFENFTEVDSYDRVIDIEMSCSENILKGFKFPITIDCEKFDRNTLLEINTSRIINDQDFGIFTDNYIENMYGVLTNNSHFTFNTIININNANITNHNQFNNNILNNIYGNIVNNGDGIFDNNSIEELNQANITNNKFFQDNTFGTIRAGQIINDDTIQNNIIETVNIINNIGRIINNYINRLGTVFNEGIIDNNIINDHCYSIYNNPDGIIQNNQFEIVEYIQGYEESHQSGTIENNIVNYLGTIANEGDIINNIIEEIQSLYNKDESIFQNNNITDVNYINNSGNIEGNNIIKAGNIYNNPGENKPVILNNYIDNIQNIENFYSITDNKLTNIEQLFNTSIISENNINNCNYLYCEEQGVITGNNINSGYYIRCWGENARLVGNTINNITDSLHNNKVFTNNNIGNIDYLYNMVTIDGNYIEDLKTIFTSEDTIIQNNRIKDIDGCSIYGQFINNIFDCSLQGCVFNNTTSNNNSIQNISNCQFGTMTDNIIEGPLNNVIVYDVLHECQFNRPVNDLTAYTLNNCIFNNINKLELYVPVYHTTFHGYIGNVTKKLTPQEQNLLSDTTKKTDAYPNIKVVCVPEMVIQTGMILMWHGGDTIPDGWAICDGNNGTPNLIDKFIKASNVSGNTGGGGNYTEGNNNNYIQLYLDNLPDHTHNIPAFDIQESGYHSHTYYDSQTSIESGTGGTYTVNYIEASGENDLASMGLQSTDYSFSIGQEESTINYTGSHTHTTNPSTTSGITGTSGTPFSIEPSYYSLIFIMKID